MFETDCLLKWQYGRAQTEKKIAIGYSQYVLPDSKDHISKSYNLNGERKKECVNSVTLCVTQTVYCWAPSPWGS